MGLFSKKEQIPSQPTEGGQRAAELRSVLDSFDAADKNPKGFTDWLGPKMEALKLNDEQKTKLTQSLTQYWQQRQAVLSDTSKQELASRDEATARKAAQRLSQYEIVESSARQVVQALVENRIPEFLKNVGEPIVESDPTEVMTQQTVQNAVDQVRSTRELERSGTGILSRVRERMTGLKSGWFSKLSLFRRNA